MFCISYVICRIGTSPVHVGFHPVVGRDEVVIITDAAPCRSVFVFFRETVERSSQMIIDWLLCREGRCKDGCGHPTFLDKGSLPTHVIVVTWAKVCTRLSSIYFCLGLGAAKLSWIL